MLSKHVTLEVESIDRMYLNANVPRLQIVEGALRFIRQQRKAKVASTNAVESMIQVSDFSVGFNLCRKIGVLRLFLT